MAEEIGLETMGLKNQTQLDWEGFISFDNPDTNYTLYVYKVYSNLCIAYSETNLI